MFVLGRVSSSLSRSTPHTHRTPAVSFISYSSIFVRVRSQLLPRVVYSAQTDKRFAIKLTPATRAVSRFLPSFIRSPHVAFVRTVRVNSIY